MKFDDGHGGIASFADAMEFAALEAVGLLMTLRRHFTVLCHQICRCADVRDLTIRVPGLGTAERSTGASSYPRSI